jgi:hypothetical protein
MGKRSTQELLRAVVQALSEGPKAINEVADATGFDRIAVTKYLSVLKEGGVLSEISDGRRRVFALVPGLSFREDTYFGLPIDHDKEKTIDSIYAFIRQQWFEKTKRYPSQVDVQKTLYKVNQLCGLKLPVGWYIFGALCVKPYDTSEDYASYGLPKEVEQCVKDVVSVYSQKQFSYEVKKQQYQEEGKKLYLLKESILSILYSRRFSKKSLFVLNKNIRELVALAPKPQDSTYDEILNEYQDLIFQMTTVLDDKSVLAIQPELTSSFEEIWKMVALYNYKADLNDFYPKEILDAHFKIDIVQQEKEIIERCSYLQSVIPPEEEPTDAQYLEIKKALASIKELSEDEKTKRKAEIEKIRKAKSDKGVQEFVLKKFNLS